MTDRSLSGNAKESAPCEAAEFPLGRTARIAVLISGRGSNMRAIHAACRSGQIDGEIVCVLSNRADAPGLEYAREQGLACRVIPHKAYLSREAYDAELVRELSGFCPDLVCLAGFMRILTPVFIAPFAGRILNIHPSLLPKYKGLDTHQRALEAGDSEAGCSIHIVTEDLDGGPVVMQKKVPVLPGDTPETLAERVLQQEHGAYVAAIDRILRGAA